MTRAAVLGAGSWGTAFTLVLADAGATVWLWARRWALAETMTTRRENPDYLPGVPLPTAVNATADVETALAGTHYVFLAVPAQELRSHLARWAPLVPADAVLVSLAKGVELHSGNRMSEVIAEAAGVRGGRGQPSGRRGRTHLRGDPGARRPAPGGDAGRRARDPGRTRRAVTFAADRRSGQSQHQARAPRLVTLARRLTRRVSRRRD